MCGPSALTVGLMAPAEAVAVLLAVDGSASAAETVALAVSVPADCGRTTIVNAMLAPVARLLSGNVRVPSPPGVTPPAAETNAAPAGSASVSVAAEAESGPWLVTVTM